jgi:hypothetical protein
MSKFEDFQSSFRSLKQSEQNQSRLDTLRSTISKESAVRFPHQINFVVNLQCEDTDEKSYKSAVGISTGEGEDGVKFSYFRFD